MNDIASTAKFRPKVAIQTHQEERIVKDEIIKVKGGTEATRNHQKVCEELSKKIREVFLVDVTREPRRQSAL